MVQLMLMSLDTLYLPVGPWRGNFSWGPNGQIGTGLEKDSNNTTPGVGSGILR